MIVMLFIVNLLNSNLVWNFLFIRVCCIGLHDLISNEISLSIRLNIVCTALCLNIVAVLQNWEQKSKYHSKDLKAKQML